MVTNIRQQQQQPQQSNEPITQIAVFAGIDTHADTHHVAVLDAHGRALGDLQVAATGAGYQQVVAFLAS